jgi:hypothetical protein
VGVATLEAVFAVFVGIFVAFVLAWLILSGLLMATFKRARTMLRRVMERRRVPRPGADDRRRAERRNT